MSGALHCARAVHTVVIARTKRAKWHARRERKLKQAERDSGNMSAQERFDLEGLREDQSPRGGGNAP